MKIAVLSDVHANYRALLRVADHLAEWRPDAVVVAGDTVNRGPRPAECLDFIRRMHDQDGWLIVRGNHEDYVIDQAQPAQPHSSLEKVVHQASHWTARQLGGDVAFLKAMPFQQCLNGPDGGQVQIVHASWRGNRDGIYPETKDSALRAQIRPAGDALPIPAVLVVGHTHRPLIRCLKDTLVVNAGSAGLPFDGDPRPSYAQITYHNGNWNAEIPRLEYDRQQAERDFYETGYLPNGGPLVELVLIELQQARSLLYAWAVRYQKKVLQGEISMQDSVSEFIAGLGPPR